ncbi:MAG: hypothetical protein H6Q15_1368 [Bacteroidetes bacterium]|nr:hypothetical protein [Bacteroidota bacterium]
MVFRTEINPIKSLQTILHKDKISLIGSCFTENIGSKLSENGFNIDINPFGIIYNPISISECIRKVANKDFLNSSDLIKVEGFWKSYSHHGDFRSENQNTCLQIINQRIESSHPILNNSKYLIITLGTAWIYTHIESQRIMGNCHKIPSNCFEKKLLNINEIVEELGQSIKLFLDNSNLENKKVIITISPIRHWKDGYRENQISKSVLHLATQELCLQDNRIEYFPSYEIVMDDLRDYRFYESDMLHPSTLAIDYIWGKFVNTFFNINTIELCKRFEHLNKMKNHRPFNPNTDSYRKHLEKIEQLEKELKKEI